MSSVSVGSLHAAPSSARPETTIGRRKAMRSAKRLSSSLKGVFITAATIISPCHSIESSHQNPNPGRPGWSLSISPLGLFVLIPFVKAFASLLAQLTFADHSPENFRRPKTLGSQRVMQIFRDVQAHIEAHKIGQAQRTHRMVVTQFHRGVDVPRAGHA